MRLLLMTMLALTLALTAACRDPEDPETQVRAAIDAMAAAAEARDVGAFMEGVSANYGDGEQRTKSDVFVMAQMYLGPGQTVHVTHRIVEVTVDEDTARARVIAGVSDGPIVAPGTRAEVLEFDVRLERDGTRWRVNRAAWDRSSVGALLGG